MRPFLLASVLLAAAPAVALAQPPAGYRDSASLRAALDGLAAGERPVSISSLGRSRGGREIPLVTVGTPAPGRPAVLVVAGLDGTHLVGSEIATELVARLVVDAALPADAVVYLVPRANPDAADATLAGPVPHARNLRPVDEDRDGATDEDGPRDLDGDGSIVEMRVRDPKPPLVATHVADANEPRLLRAADPLKGETPMYAVLVESVDADGDGGFGEDPPGGVTLDRNFPHRWPEFSADAGPFPLSEPETLALAAFVRDRRDLAAAIVLGRHDNAVNFPDTRDMDGTGRTPMVFLAADHPLHRDLATLAKETTGQKRSTNADPAGSFWLWLVNHRGIPTLALTGWGRPDPSPPAEGAAPAPEKPADQPAEPAKDAAPEAAASEPAPAAPPPGRGRRGGGGRPGAPASPAAPAPKPTVDEEQLAWLAVNDRDRNGELFVPWREIDHPERERLGAAVEVGGFRPLLLMNPPQAEIAGLADRHAALVRELAMRLPRVEVEPATFTRLADGLYRVELSLRNAGRLPTATNMGRTAEALPPIVVRLSAPVERVLAGERVRRIDRLDAGERQVLSWLVALDGTEPLDLVVTTPADGRHEQRFVPDAAKTAPGGTP